MVDLVREYSVASSNSPIADAEIHGLLVHAQVDILELLRFLTQAATAPNVKGVGNGNGREGGNTMREKAGP